MTFTLKTWFNYVGGGTPTDAAGLNDLEARIGAAISGGRYWFPEDFGATGVGDDTTALNNAIAAMSAGDTLIIRSGKVYRHSAVWDINKAGISVVGRGEIRATAEATSAVWLHADDIYVEDVKFTCPTVTTRGSTLNHHKLVLNQCARPRLVRARVVGSKACGIFSYGASDYVIDHPDVDTTAADGIHNTFGSTRGKIYSPRVQNSTDDGIAVVSYSNETICSNIDVYDPKVSNVIQARMFSIVGGQDIHYHNVDGDGSWAAGMYIACEASYLSHGILRCSMSGRIKNAQSVSSPTRPDHGAVLIYNDRSGFAVDSVVVEAEIWNTWTGASRIVGLLQFNTGTVSDIHVGPMIYRGTNPSNVFDTNAAGSAYFLDNVSGAGGGVTAVNTANSGSAITLGAPATYAINDITLNAATPAITLPTALAGQSFTLVLRQDGTGGRVPSWVGTVKWPGGASPTLTPAASAVDVVTFVCVVAGTWLGFPAGYDVK